MSGAARAFWVIGPGRGEMRDETLAPAKTGEVLVRALFSGISRGTEALVFAARVPASQYAVMRAPFQVGEFPAPVKYGHACVGIVEDGDEITIDTESRCLEVALSDAEIASRLGAWRAPEPRYKIGVMAKYARLVSSASRGAVTC